MIDADHLASLRRVALFAEFQDAEFARVAKVVHSRTVPPETCIIRANEPGDVLFALVAGSVRVHIEQADGSDVILAIFGPGEVVGEISVVDSLGRSASVTTLEESTVLSIARSDFWECLRTVPAMSYGLVLVLCRRLRLANSHIECLASLDVSGRVALQLSALAQEYGERQEDGSILIPIRLTQTDLANFVGASRVRVNQVLVAYKRLGYVSVDQRQRFVINDPSGLVRYLPDQHLLHPRGEKAGP